MAMNNCLNLLLSYATYVAKEGEICFYESYISIGE